MVSPILYFNKVCWNLRCVKHNYRYSKLIKYSVWQLFAISHLILTADICVLYKTAGEGTADCQQRAMLSVLHLPVWVSTRRPLHQDTLLPLLPLSLFGKAPANLAADLRRGTRQAASLATYQHLSSETMRKSTEFTLYLLSIKCAKWDSIFLLASHLLDKSIFYIVFSFNKFWSDIKVPGIHFKVQSGQNFCARRWLVTTSCTKNIVCSCCNRYTLWINATT